MTTLEIILIALALSLDAFSVSITCGIKLEKWILTKYVKIALFFGLFQSIMPIGGYFLANTILKDSLQNYAKWIAFTVFLLLALKTFYDYFHDQNKHEKRHCECNGYRCLTTLAIATSIDAFLVGSVLGLKESNFLFAIIIIGIITFLNSIIGLMLGNNSINYLKDKSRICAGFILLIISLKELI